MTGPFTISCLSQTTVGPWPWLDNWLLDFDGCQWSSGWSMKQVQSSWWLEKVFKNQRHTAERLLRQSHVSFSSIFLPSCHSKHLTAVMSSIFIVIPQLPRPIVSLFTPSLPPPFRGSISREYSACVDSSSWIQTKSPRIFLIISYAVRTWTWVWTCSDPTQENHAAMIMSQRPLKMESRLLSQVLSSHSLLSLSLSLSLGLCLSLSVSLFLSPVQRLFSSLQTGAWLIRLASVKSCCSSDSDSEAALNNTESRTNIWLLSLIPL